MEAIQQSLKKLECTVRSRLFWPELRIDDRFLLDVTKKGKPASEHIVFFCNMTKGDNVFPVVVKYCMTNQATNKAALMSTLHSQQKCKNYQDLANHLLQYDFGDITVNSVCIARTTEGKYLWIEKELPYFVRFGDHYSGNRVMVACASASHKRLRLLQKSIFESSGLQRTVCDLQGYRVPETGQYILADIEFTDTMHHLHWSPQELRSAFVESMKGTGDEKLPEKKN